MRKVFWDDPYQVELTTRVTEVKGEEVLFDGTIAYSFCGGQEDDRAWVNGIPILSSRREGNLIFYRLPNGHGLLPGDRVHMRIDWQRRLRLMRLHFAAELILEIVTRKYGLEKVGAHIAESKSRIDFVFSEHISSLFDEVLLDYEAIIIANLPIETGFTDEATLRRYWKIEGFAQVSCGGTHVRSTKEVGLVSLKRARAGRGIERIEIRLIADRV